MHRLLDAVGNTPLLQQPPLGIVISVVMFSAFLLIVGAIVLDFKKYYRQDRAVTASDRSFVETGSMTAFFIAYYVVLRLGWTQLALDSAAVRAAAIAVGLALVVLGTAFNLWGRTHLKAAWANQIRIYDGHELITTGPFRIVRHPLYASLIWIFIGGSLIYLNPLALALALLVFVPMMYVRAKKEDALLEEAFGEQYSRYRLKTGLFLPRLRSRHG
jgi:protein-S-isoprenylcysteine O-methyltransferase Ste14